MRIIFSAVVIGLAVAGGVLGLLQAPVESGVRRPQSDQATPKLPAAHSDASTWSSKPVRLNQNVIDGKSTVVCTTDGGLFPVLGPVHSNRGLCQSLGNGLAAGPMGICNSAMHSGRGSRRSCRLHAGTAIYPHDRCWRVGCS